MRLIVLSLIALALASGCIGQTVVPTGTGSLSITLTADPPSFFQGETSRLFIDFENIDTLPVADLSIFVFDAGPLLATSAAQPGAPCGIRAAKLEPREIGSLECVLSLPPGTQLVKLATPVTIQLRGLFRKRLSGTAVVELIDLEELRRRERAGTLVRSPASFTFEDRNIRTSLSFGPPQPFIEQVPVLSRLEVRSKGDGQVFTLAPSDLTIEQPGEIFGCTLQTALQSDEGVFPPITCQLRVPDIVISESYPISINLDYTYEIRKSTTVTVTTV